MRHEDVGRAVDSPSMPSARCPVPVPMRAARLPLAAPASVSVAGRSLCVVLHDVAPATLAACERVCAAVREVADVPMTLLAVPRYHGHASTIDFEQWVTARQTAGDEIALHGYTHLDDGQPRDWVDRLRRQHYTRGEGEFWDLTPSDAIRRLVNGKRWFQRNRWRLRGFVAPAWLLGDVAWRVLPELRLEYTCTLGAMHLLPGMERVPSQALVYSCSTPWRRQMSLCWNRTLALRLHANPLLRLELHPPDADHPAIQRSWQRLLEKHLADREALTMGDWAEASRGLRTSA